MAKAASDRRVRFAEPRAREPRSRRTIAADPLTESVSLWFRLLSCHSVMLATLRRELEDRITLAMGKQ